MVGIFVCLAARIVGSVEWFGRMRSATIIRLVSCLYFAFKRYERYSEGFETPSQHGKKIWTLPGLN